MVDQTADDSLTAKDPETGCSYSAFSEVSALMPDYFMVVSDEKCSHIAFPTDYHRVCLTSRQLGFLKSTSNPEKTVFVNKGV